MKSLETVTTLIVKYNAPSPKTIAAAILINRQQLMRAVTLLAISNCRFWSQSQLWLDKVHLNPTDSDPYFISSKRKIKAIL